MSLAEKFEEYAKADADERYETTEQMMKAAFYAGAEAVMYSSSDPRIMQAEIDHFRERRGQADER